MAGTICQIESTSTQENLLHQSIKFGILHWQSAHPRACKYCQFCGVGHCKGLKRSLSFQQKVIKAKNSTNLPQSSYCTRWCPSSPRAWGTIRSNASMENNVKCISIATFRKNELFCMEGFFLVISKIHESLQYFLLCNTSSKKLRKDGWNAFIFWFFLQ